MKYLISLVVQMGMSTKAVVNDIDNYICVGGEKCMEKGALGMSLVQYVGLCNCESNFIFIKPTKDICRVYLSR